VGEISDGHRTVDQALLRAEHHGERWYSAEFLRIKGELLRAEHTPQSRLQTEEQSHRSLACAREQEALSWELRTSISLSRMYQEQGQTHAAWDALTPVYARFKEGFNTADLKAAKALINQLSE